LYSIIKLTSIGACSEWKANALGKSDKIVKEFLEKNYTENLSEVDTIKLTVKVNILKIYMKK
jgi:20S proteasome alpha/beta subunit